MVQVADQEEAKITTPSSAKLVRWGITRT
jgi:hypothetical protein